MFNPFDPASWFAQFAKDALLWLQNLTKTLLVNPPRPKGGQWSDYLYGNGLGLGQYLAVIVAVILACLAVITKRAAGKAVHAIMVGVIITALAPVYFGLCDQVVAAGDTLVKAAQIADKIGGTAQVAPDANAPLVVIIGGILIFPTGVVLAAIIVGFELIIIVVKTLGLVVLALSPFSEAARRRLELLVSLAIIAMLTGRPVAIFITEIGQVLLNNTYLGSFAFNVAIVLFVANIAAIWAQLWMVRKVHQAVANVSGRTLASVTGSVETLTRSGSKTTVESVNAVNNRALLPIGQPGSRLHDARQAVRQEISTRRAAALTARVASSNPYVQGAAAAYNRYRSRRTNPSTRR